jgi:general secretion pathway protein H
VSRGYTLMELIVMLAVLAIAAAVVAPAVGRTVDDVKTRAELAGVAAFLRGARERAVTRQHAYEVVLDVGTRALLLRRAGREDEAAVQAVRPLPARLQVQAEIPRVVFLPHGMSSGARFAFEAPGPRRYVMTVDVLTGRVTTRRGGP